MKRVLVAFRIYEDLKQQLKEEAQQRGLTLSAYINLILSERNDKR